MADLVIGSGPSGIAAAMALRARGRAVVIVDGGRDVDPASEPLRQRLVATLPADWSAADIAGWRAGQMDAPPAEIRRYGSAHAVEPADATFAEGGAELALRASRAVGGLSNVWGAAVLPYHHADMAGWPITPADLAPHYRAVAGFMPMSGRADALAALFPEPDMTGRPTIPPGPQAEAVLARFRGHAGVTLGLARQAVEADCRLCGQCLQGCPWHLIYSTRRTLADLRADPGVTYRPGFRVHRFEETAAGARILAEDGREIAGDRVFLAAGVLETARIALRSLPLPHLDLADSQHGFLPLIQPARLARRPDALPLHTLPQMFAEIEDPEISPNLVHAQFYGWNEYYARDLLANYGRIAAARPLLRSLALRLVVAQIFLHSRHSARARLTLAADGRLKARVTASAESRPVLSAAARRLGRAMRGAGLHPLTFALRPGAPGSSFHAGATLAMASSPRADQTDRLGRPAGLERIHVVDASVLPAIPATTITFSVMANAHRIASAAP